MSAARRPRWKPTLEGVRQQFSQWRQSRGRGERIPEDLWAAAAGLTREHSIHTVSRFLHLNHSDLKERAAAKAGRRGPARTSPFVEVPVPGPGGVAAQYLVEFEGSKGKKLRVEMRGVRTEDVTGLVRELWGYRA